MTGAQQGSTFRSIAGLARATWDATKGDRGRFFSFLVLCLLALIVDLTIPWVIGSTLEVFVKEGFSPHALESSLLWVLAFMALRTINTVAHHLSRYLQGTTSYTARFRKLQEVFSGLMAFPLKWHVHHHTGENLSKLYRSVGAIETVINNYTWQILEGVSRFVLAVTLVFVLDFEVATTVLAMGVVIVSVMLSFNSRLTKTIRRNNRFYDRQYRTCADYLTNIITVKTLRLEEPAVGYLTKQRDEGFALSKRIWCYQELKWGTVDLGYGIVMGVSMLIYFNNHAASGEVFDIAKVYVLLNYLDRIFGAISMFTGYYGGIMEAAISYDDASTLLPKDGEAIPALTTSRRISSSWKSLEIKDVEFSYGGDAPNLRGVTLEIKKGEKIAFVGPSGGGKSTLLKVLAGMLMVREGSVDVDDQRGLSIDDVASISLLIPQEPEIFSESVRFNLSFNQDFTPAELEKAVEICRIDHILQKLPNGWDSDLEEAGLNISVGERQRLALARGILRAPGKDILLLDEPTSSLDPMTEKQIFHGLLHRFSEQTIITACHRLALVPMFDKIVYIRDGRIEEVGSFTELRATGKAFAAAWEDYERNILSGEQAA